MAELTPDEQDARLIELSEPFGADKIKQFKGRGGKLFDYVEGVEVLKRLNAVAKEWSFVNVQLSETRTVDKEGEVHPVTRVIGELEIPGLGRRTGMGVQVMKAGSGEDLEKGALTDAIKNAASKFGVALELYANEDETRRNWTSIADEGATGPQKKFIRDLIGQGTIDKHVLRDEYKVATADDLTKAQARAILDRFAPKKEERQPVPAGGLPDGPPDDDLYDPDQYGF